MSGYQKHKTCYKFKEDLVAALEKIYGSGKVEVFDHDKLGTAIGYHSQIQAEIIVRRAVVGSGYGDLAFYRDKDGMFVVMKDDGMRVDFRHLSRTYLDCRIARDRGLRVLDRSDERIKIQVI